MLAVVEEQTWFKWASCLGFPCAIMNQLGEVWYGIRFSKRQVLQLKNGGNFSPFKGGCEH